MLIKYSKKQHQVCERRKVQQLLSFQYFMLCKIKDKSKNTTELARIQQYQYCASKTGLILFLHQTLWLICEKVYRVSFF